MAMSKEDIDRYIEHGGLYVDADNGCIWHEGVKYVPERTCSVRESYHDVDGSWHYLTCGHRADTWLDDPPEYCPNCGARVVKEEQ